MKLKTIIALLVLSVSIPFHNVSGDDVLDFMPAIIAGAQSESSEIESPEIENPDGVVLNRNFTTTTDFFGDLLIVGEISNNTDSAIQFVSIDANIFNGGQLVETAFSFVFREIMPPRSTSCFRMSTGYAGPFTRVSFEPIDFIEPISQRAPLSISNVTRRADFVGDIELLGTVTNNSSRRAESVIVSSTFYASDNSVIDCEIAFLGSSSLNAGQSGNFNMITFTPNSSVSRFVLQPSGTL